jgi:glutaconyl-CoA/methylmalonyl-CoA decarboxylase subunit delta
MDTIFVDTALTAADTLQAAEKILQEITFDPSRILENDGVIITVIGYVVVFFALLFLFIIFKSIAKAMQRNLKKDLRKKGEAGEIKKDEVSVSGEINAAISMALYLYLNEIHDDENIVLTIKKAQTPYSPWSSKIYGLREFHKN